MTQESKEDAEKLAYAKKVQSSSNLRREIIIKRHKNELKNLKGKDFERKTEIIDDENSISAKLEVPEAKVYFSFNKYHYLCLSDHKFDDALETTNKHRLGFIDENGICYNLFLENEKMTNSAGVLVDTLLKTQAPIIGYTQFIDDEDERDLLYVFADGHVKLSDVRKFKTKSRYTKVTSGKTKRKIAQVFNVPFGANKITINDKTFAIDKLFTYKQDEANYMACAVSCWKRLLTRY